MSAAFRSEAHGNVASPNIIVSKPAGVVDGDGLIVAIYNAVGATTTPPAGWTLVKETVAAGNTGCLSVFKKFAASEGSTWTFTLSQSSISTLWVCLAYSNPGNVVVVEASVGAATGQTTATQTAASVTTLTSNAIVLAILGADASSAPSSTPPTGMTERVDFAAFSILLLTAADATQAAAGASGAKIFTVATAPISGAIYCTLSILSEKVPTVTAVTPAYGVIAGGTPISIAGTNFQAPGFVANSVTVGGVACTDVVTVSDTQITCVTGAHAVGNVPVVVTNSNGSGTL